MNPFKTFSTRKKVAFYIGTALIIIAMVYAFAYGQWSSISSLGY